MRRVALFVRKAAEDSAGEPVTFTNAVIKIGRDDDADLKLDHRTISTLHATLRSKGDHCTLTDEESRNGTFVGQVQLAPHRPRLVRPGDLLRLGNVWLELQFLSEEEENDAPTTGELALAMISREVRELRGPHVVVAEGTDFGAELSLREDGQALTVGYGQGHDLQLTDREVRPSHLRIVRRGSSFFLSARHSFSLGTSRIAPGNEVEGPPRLMVRVGDTVLALEVPSERAKVILASLPTPTQKAEPVVISPLPLPESVAPALAPQPSPEPMAPAAAAAPEGSAAPLVHVDLTERPSTTKAAPRRADHAGRLLVFAIVSMIVLAIGALVILLRSG